MKHFQGFWECDACHHENEGDKLSCDVCGNSLKYGMDKFYPISNITGKQGRELSESEIHENPHWQCVACGSMNLDKDDKCHHCITYRSDYPDLAVHNESETAKVGTTYNDILERMDKQDKQDLDSQFSEKERTLANPQYLESIANFIKQNYMKGLIASLLVILGIGIYQLSLPVEKKLVRQYVNIESNRYETKTFNGEGFDYPIGAYSILTESRLHHYDDVYDHTEHKVRKVTKTRKVGEKCTDVKETVSDGQTISDYRTKNKGNGQFVKEPIYTTKYKTVTRRKCTDVMESYLADENYDEKIYRKEPVYKPYYRYKYDKDVVVETAKCSFGGKKYDACKTGNRWESKYSYRFVFEDGDDVGISKFQYDNARINDVYMVSRLGIVTDKK